VDRRADGPALLRHQHRRPDDDLVERHLALHAALRRQPAARGGDASRRLSFAYFCNPNDDLLIECLPTCCGPGRPARHAPIRAGEHRFRKIEMSKAALRGAA
jgi:hypothetical protein